MEDSTIIQLYWQRNEAAIGHTKQKYGAYCGTIAKNILPDARDREECLSDTWLQAWNAMPPQRPRVLRSFLGAITRNLAFSRWRYLTAEKRGGGAMEAVLEELSECVSGVESAEEEAQRRELLEAIEEILRTWPEKKRQLFLGRYWYAESVETLAKRVHATPGSVSAQLHRLRETLRKELTERGYWL